MAHFWTKPSARRSALWLVGSVMMGIFTGLVQLAYHEKDFGIHYAFASSDPFEIELSGEILAPSENGRILTPSYRLPFTSVLEGKELNFAENPPLLFWRETPRELEIIRYRRLSPDPYSVALFNYYDYLSSWLKSQLQWFEFNPALNQFQYEIRDKISLNAERLSSKFAINSALWGENRENNYDFWAWGKMGIGLIALHSLLFVIAFSPALFWTREKTKKLGNLSKHPMILFLSLLTAFVWGAYSLTLVSQAGVFRGGFFLGLSAWLPFLVLGFLFYAGLISLAWTLVRRTLFPVRLLVLILILAGFVLLFLQTGFLIYTSNLIRVEFFTMVTKETIFFAFDTLTICLIVGLLGLTGFLFLGERKHPVSFPWYFLSFSPAILLLSYSLSFGTSLALARKDFPIYNLGHPVGRLTFNPFLQAPLEFNRELVRYLKLVLVPSNQTLNFTKMTEEDQKTAEAYGIHLGAESSHFPAGDKPFKRIILLTIEGYRLAYIPEFNPALKGIVKPFPFFSRPEILASEVPNYYASAPVTTRAMLTILNSHTNVLALRSSRDDLPKLPSLTKLLAEAGFKNLFIKTVEVSFDNWHLLFGAMNLPITEMTRFEFVGSADYQKAGLTNPLSWVYPSRLLFQEVVGQLTKNKAENTPSFTMIINTDTHNPPMGMAMTNPASYGSLVYPNPILNAKGLSGATLNTLISTYRFAYDLDIFYENLKSSGLWDEETLLIITADHSQSSPDESLYPSHIPRVEELPLFIVSPRKLPKTTSGIYGSHLDLAPTILDLAGLPKPVGYWGQSLYNPNTKGRKAWFNDKEGVLYTLDEKGLEELNFALYPNLRELFKKFFVDSLPSPEAPELSEDRP